MPNVIKYTTGATETGCLRKGNMQIGNNTADYGATFWNGINPPSGGYTIYLNKASGGPSIYCPTNNTQLIGITNQIAGANYTTAAQCLAYFASQTDKLCVNFNYEGIVTNGLVLNLDAGFDPSYPTTGTNIYDISGNNNNGSLTNGPTFNSANSGSIVYDGVDDYTNVSYAANLSLVTNHTLETWFYPTGTGGAGGGGDGTLIRAGQGTDLQYCQFFRDTDLSVNYHWYDSGFQLVSTAANTVSFNNWYAYTAVKNGTNLKLYINGSELVNTTITNSTNGSFGSINIGNTTGNGFQKYNGRIAINRIYNRALTSAEVLQNYNAQKGRFGL